MVIENPVLGQVRVSKELIKKGLLIAPGGGRNVWLRYDMETFKKWLKAFDTFITQNSIVLTENQTAALEPKRVK